MDSEHVWITADTFTSSMAAYRSFTSAHLEAQRLLADKKVFRVAPGDTFPGDHPCHILFFYRDQAGGLQDVSIQRRLVRP